MRIENAVVEESSEEAQETKQEPEKVSGPSPMRAILIKSGEYVLSNSFVLPSLDLCFVGEQGTILAPKPNALAILGVGNKDIKCSKCGYVLAMKIKRQQIQNLAIKCPACGNLNEL
jgi:Zn finger protein HypA/HybF involved in hydrogenase expression